MDFRSDLAVEWNVKPDCEGIHLDAWEQDDARLTRIFVSSQSAAAQLQRPVGNYLTVEFPSETMDTRCAKYAALLAQQIRKLLPPSSPILIAGIGNRRITPDALGPLAADMVLATRHIDAEFSHSCGLDDLRPTAVVVPGVLGQTGIESGEVVAALCRSVSPGAVIVIDALAARLVSRIGCTVQINDTGIAPGSGVGNHRLAIDKETLGVPVIAIGIPMVVDAATLVRELSDAQDIDITCHSMVVTPREIDVMVQRGARLIAYAVNSALQPDYDPTELAAIANS